MHHSTDNSEFIVSLTTLTNCTFSQNLVISNPVGSGLDTTTGQIGIRNSIFWENGGPCTPPGSLCNKFSDRQIAGGVVNPPTIRYTTIEDADPGDGNIPFNTPPASNLDVDPQYTDILGDDGVLGTPDDNVRLDSTILTSPGVDSGNNGDLPADVFDIDDMAGTTVLPLDFDGRTRIINGTVDMGAFEANCLTDADCDDGMACTTEFCDPGDSSANPNGCRFVETCDDDDSCTCDSCDPTDGTCAHDGNSSGDLDCNGVINLFDLFCVLDGFAGDFSTCTFANVDRQPCGGNGVINLFDLFAVLDTFNGVDPCCSTAPLGFFASGLAVGPPPGGPATIGITMSAVPASGFAGDLFDVEVFGGEFANLRGYEIGLSASGGTTGSLTLEDIVVDELRSDYVFAGLSPFQSFDTSTVRMLNALDGDVVASLTAEYLATFKFRASADASGTFTVSVRPDPDTLAVDSTSTKMTVVIVSDTQITIP